MLHMKCVPTAISGGVDIYNICVLSEGKKKILQGLVSYELTAYLSVFDPF